MTIFGVHTGLQNTTVEELVNLWRRIEDLGFGWISVWDHFYAADGTGEPECLEAVSMHAALACNTTRVRCGCLVYSVGYRHPAVLANAIATIDHLSGGRADIGVGGGWSQVEYDAYGIPFPPVGVRLRQLEEGAACVRGLLRNDRTTFEGEYFQLRDAQCEPRPVQAELPIWIGGGGEKKTLRVAARYADGWNVPFIAPDAYRHKVGVLHQHCDDVGRDPSEIRLSINVGMASSEDDLRAQFGNIANFVRPGVLMGSDQEILDKVGAYEEAGAQQINIAMRAPWDVDGLERLAAALPLG
ncbi:MAG TPA: TIGR03560 family F420-dependent LLM class oxidoreductase [Acidimicrobiales bacterium]|jgi:F420-dependent oxidoreductase-like protein|nr:TIGR03560 family F420-dependent LLM class oxidoreductase [Acidimicrobiales bacterium]